MNQVIRPKSSSNKSARSAAPAAPLATRTPPLPKGKESSPEEDLSPPGDDQTPDHTKIKLKGRGWTLGNSASLMEGTEDESVFATIGWILIPTVIFALLLAAMIYR